MKIIKKGLILIVFLVSVFIYSPQSAQAEGKENLAVMFIIDDSGSMSGNDHDLLRYTAAKLFIASLDIGDYVAGIQFSSKSFLLTNDFERIISSETKLALMNSFSAQEIDGYTDVKSAFSLAEEVFATIEHIDSQKVIVFLTDGKPELDRPYAAYEAETLKLIARLEIPVYAIALTPAGQTAFLSEVVSQTNGQLIPSHTVNDLLDSYLQILGEIKDRSVLGEGAISSPDSEEIWLEPALMPFVSKLSFIVSKDPGVAVTLYDPEGQLFQESNHEILFSKRDDPAFEVITIAHPLAGSWRFVTEGDGKAQVRAVLHSKLRIDIQSPVDYGGVGQSMAITLHLNEELSSGKVVTIIGEATFSALITKPDGTQESLDQFYDDGTHGDLLAEDGLYTRIYKNVDQPGRYIIAVTGNKGGVMIEGKRFTEVIELPTLQIIEPALEEYAIRSNEVPLLIMLEGRRDLFEGSVLAQIKSPTGNLQEMILISDGEQFSAGFIPAETGVYQITYQTIGASYQGMQFEVKVNQSIQINIVPSIDVEGIFLHPQQIKKDWRFEPGDLIKGVPAYLLLDSTALEDVTLMLDLIDLPGFSISPRTVVVSGPGEKTIGLSLSTSNQIPFGTWQGQIAISSGDTVDLSHNRMGLEIVVFEPWVEIESLMQVSTNLETCHDAPKVSVVLDITSTSVRTEILSLELAGMEAYTLTQTAIEVLPGKQQVVIPLQGSTSLTGAGDYEGELIVHSSREELQLGNDTSHPIRFTVSPVWTRCQRPLIYLGVGLVGVVMLLIQMKRKFKQQTEPPKISGTLLYWPIEYHNKIVSVDLTAIEKSEITLGSNTECDVVIPDPTVAKHHLTIFTQAGAFENVKVMLQPVEKVIKGYQSYIEPTALEDQAMYQIGQIIFQIIEDPNEY